MSAFSTSSLKSSITEITQPKTLLSCQLHSYQKESTNKVLFCKKLAEGENYKVLLQDSVLYPEGGGQPYDLGTVGGLSVVNVTKPDSLPDGLATNADIARIVEVELDGPLEVGSVVKCEVDWSRRYDFMQQHSAQHLFSAIADKLLGAPTVGWSLGPELVMVELSCNPLLTTQQLQEIEDETNAMIRENKSITYKVLSKEEIQENLKLKAENNARNEFVNFRGEVKGAALAMDELRLINIEGIDLNPCGGTHISNLSELNVFKIISTEREVNNHLLRVKFVAGNRALSYFKQSVERDTAISQLLSLKPTDFVTNIDRLLKDKKDLNKKFDVYNEELAYYFGLSLSSKVQKEFETKGKSELITIVEHRYGADLKFILKAASTLFENLPSEIDNVLLFLSGDENSPVLPAVMTQAAAKGAGGKKAKGGADGKAAAPVGKPLTEGPFVLFGQPTVVDKVKEGVLAALSARGGGRPGRMQGYATNLAACNDVTGILSSANK